MYNDTNNTNFISLWPLFIEGDVNSTTRELNLSNYFGFKVFEYVVDLIRIG